MNWYIFFVINYTHGENAYITKANDPEEAMDILIEKGLIGPRQPADQAKYHGWHRHVVRYVVVDVLRVVSGTKHDSTFTVLRNKEEKA